ncbi:transcriptional regulator [Serinibacter arcticus]|uniref:Transcriptional regulator n=1 Tax=Serinibacter arcticus TaxID=1655435 RepID=A0A2U1ZWD7_9MICO|nr:FMN-binding negative transcriptional regulator [Serinibacter arcticus]PWD51307.1 transcriptional regulator [Serinibacter arcticus]
MLDTPDYEVHDVAWVRDLLARRPWMTIVAAPGGVPTATHMPVLLEDAPAGDPGAPLTLVTHLGIPDDEILGLADGVEVLVVVEGASGYVSPGWYAWGPAVPTWNYEAAHLRARVEMLDAEATWDALVATIDVFERERSEPFVLTTAGPGGTDDLAYARRIQRGVVGARLHVTSWQAKSKLSQDKPPEVVARIVRGLETDGDPHADAGLAVAMRTAHGLGSRGHAGAGLAGDVA